jgi:hypothetical protein
MKYLVLPSSFSFFVALLVFSCASLSNAALQVGFNPDHVLFVPVAAVFGDCILERSPRISWYVIHPT